MDRRLFLHRLTTGLIATAAAAVVDPERLLWVPGAKTFFLSPATPTIALPGLIVGDIFTIDGVFSVNPINRGVLQQFVVTADTRVASIDNAPIVLPIIESGACYTSDL